MTARKDGKPKKPRPEDVKSQLYDAADVAHGLVKLLKPLVDSGVILGREERENFKLARDVLRGVRELHIRAAALAKNQAVVQQAVSLHLAQPASVSEVSELRRLAAEVVASTEKPA